ncbi:cysteine hydrolase family protein [Lichenicoccus sp.]|uniref:cysteine hydrolase family protein n=1 Tax=Lichenicoccus sp. TaxID=2781899 RepID=UPI003D0C62FC
MKRLGSVGHNAWHVSPDQVDMARRRRAPVPRLVAALPRPVRIDLAACAMIVIDMQNDFCHPGGWLAGIGVDVTLTRAPVKPLRRLLPALRAQSVPVLWVNWGNRPDRLNLSPSLHNVYDPCGDGAGLGAPLAEDGSGVLEAGSWGAAIIDELQPAPEDVHVAKYRMSGFWDTPLDSILRNLRIDTLLFAGVNVDQCVMATLQDAGCLGYDCLLVDDCAATTSPAFCLEATRYNVRQCYGFTTDADALIKAADASE